MKNHNKTIVAGIALLILAWITAGSIPERANSKYFKRWGAETGTTFTASRVQMIATTMQLRNFYVGAAGLICLGCGILSASKKQSTVGDQ
ncbi:MAG: hypothetical protein V4819_16435 [Verrucomicrobiota bacterium]